MNKVIKISELAEVCRRRPKRKALGIDRIVASRPQSLLEINNLGFQTREHWAKTDLSSSNFREGIGQNLTSLPGKRIRGSVSANLVSTRQEES